MFGEDIQVYSTNSGVKIYLNNPEEKTDKKDDLNVSIFPVLSEEESDKKDTSVTYMTKYGASIFPALPEEEPETNSPSSLFDLLIIDGTSKAQQSDPTRNGAIEYVKQGDVSDCGILSLLTSMSYSPRGREIIENALEYHDDYTIVHLAVGDYRVDNETIEKYRADKRVSEGDTDMAIIEIAMEKAIDDIITGKLTVSDDAPFEIQYLKENKQSGPTTSSIDFVFPHAIFYLLTGKTGQINPMGPIEYYGMPPELDRFQNDQSGDYLITACSNFFEEDGYMGIVPKEGHTEEALLKDFVDIKTGQTIPIVVGHAFSVKEVTDKGVTLVNPWDTSQSITISKEEFANSFYIMTCDLSDNYPEKPYIQ